MIRVKDGGPSGGGEDQKEDEDKNGKNGTAAAGDEPASDGLLSCGGLRSRGFPNGCFRDGDDRTGRGEIRLSVTDLSDTGADGYETQYRMKGSKEWGTAAFEAGRTDLVISGLQAGEYEIQVRAFVDNTADSVPEEHRKTAYGPYGDIRTVTVP